MRIERLTGVMSGKIGLNAVLDLPFDVNLFYNKDSGAIRDTLLEIISDT
jgi:hypothetical protein